MWETWVCSLGWEGPLEEGTNWEYMATHSSILAWKIPWTEEADRLQSMGCKELDMIEGRQFLSFFSGQWCLYTHSFADTDVLQTFAKNDVNLGSVALIDAVYQIKRDLFWFLLLRV